MKVSIVMKKKLLIAVFVAFVMSGMQVALADQKGTNGGGPGNGHGGTGQALRSDVTGEKGASAGAGHGGNG